MRARRIFFIMLLMFLVFNIFFFRLFQLQILKSGTFSVMAVDQRNLKLQLGSGRGNIFDRNGVSLLDSRDEKAIVIFPDYIKGMEEEIVSRYSWLQNIEDILSNQGPRPFVLTTFLNEEELVGEKLPPGTSIMDYNVRYGPNNLAPHVVGHLNRIDGYGVAGLELYYDSILSPSHSPTVSAVVDGRRRLVSGIGYRYFENTDILKPYNLHLTLDVDIQKVVEEVMEKRITKGAVVVMDPFSGDVLAMASMPDFDPNNIAQLYSNTEESEALLARFPFLNRSIRSFFPGSTIKVILAAAALDSGEYTLDHKFNCPGYIEIGKDRKKCNVEHGHGELSLADALAYSCNVVFMEIGLNLGGKTFLEYAHKFGLGEKTGINLQLERPGILPSSGMGIGSLALASIGQGEMGITPLQMARAYSVVANGGYLIEPRLVDKITTKNNITVKQYPTATSEKVLDTNIVSELQKIMHGVTKVGTGRDAASSLYNAAGKTGTAQTGRIIDGKEELYYWFAGFAPLENPQYVVAVFLEKKSEVTPARIFREIMEKVIQL